MNTLIIMMNDNNDDKEDLLVNMYNLKTKTSNE